MKYKNLVVVGTSHIAEQSLQEVEQAIEKEKPDIIAIELDRKRLYALTHKVKRKIGLSDIKRVGIKGFLFNVIGAFAERKLGKMVGVEPGSDMMRAIQLAKKNKIQLALIDQDIEITLKKISKSFGWREKIHLVVDLFKGVFFGKRELKRLGLTQLDLTKVPSKKLITTLIKEMKRRYPSLYKVLVEERNIFMAGMLKRIIAEHPEKKIVAIIGAGHEDEIMEMVKGPEITYSFAIRNVYKQ